MGKQRKIQCFLQCNYLLDAAAQVLLKVEDYSLLEDCHSCTVKIHVGQSKAQTARRAAKYNVLCQCRETEKDRRAEDIRGTA